jgi:hypothetical protein
MDEDDHEAQEFVIKATAATMFIGATVQFFF